MLSICCGTAAQKGRGVKTSQMKCKISGSVDKKLFSGKVYFNNPLLADDAKRLDSCLIKDGKFAFETDFEEIPCQRSISLKKNDGNTEEATVFLDCDEIKVTWDKDEQRLLVSGSESNENWCNYTAETAKLNAEEESHWVVYRDKSQPRALRDAAMGKADSIHAITSRIARRYMLQNLDNVMGTVLAGEFKSYLTYNESEQYLEKSPKMFQETDAWKSVQKHFNNESLTQEGADFTDFEMPDPSGRLVKLSDIAVAGQYTILDFWASWCPSCRYELPMMKRIYEEFKDEFVEIVGISFDRNREDWLNAIKTQKLDWKHLSEAKGWDSVAKAKYGIEFIPSIVVIGPDCRILAKHLSAAELYQKLLMWTGKKRPSH